MNKEQIIEEMRNDIPNNLEIDGKDIDTICEILTEKSWKKERQGEWYKHDKKKHGDTLYHCSVCEKIAPSDCLIWELTDYCPNCGARMKGE